MRRFLQHLSKSDWMLVIGGLAVVFGLQMAKRAAPPDMPEAQAELATPVTTPGPAGLPPSPTGLAEDAYHLRPTQSEHQPDAQPARLMPDPGHSAVFFGSVTRVAPLGPLPVGALRKTFDELMLSAPYFGAFASAESGAYGWTSGYGTQAAARAAALAHCGQHAQDCRIIAELLPVELTGEAPDNSFSYDQSLAYQAIRAREGPRALAVSIDGSWAFSAASSHPEAIATVLRNCENSRSGTQAYLSKMPCRVFATWE